MEPPRPAELLSAEKYARKVSWASHYDLETGRPLEVEGQDFAEGPAMVSPMGLGAHNWHPMSYSPRTGLVYIPAMEGSAPMQDEPVFRASRRVFSTGNESDGQIHNAQLTQTLLPALMKGYLLAWNPREQRSAWEVDHSTMGNGGTLVTAGDLVFQGMLDGGFMAFDARDGTAVAWDWPSQIILAVPRVDHDSSAVELSERALIARHGSRRDRPALAAVIGVIHGHCNSSSFVRHLSCCHTNKSCLYRSGSWPRCDMAQGRRRCTSHPRPRTTSASAVVPYEGPSAAECRCQDLDNRRCCGAKRAQGIR